ncbi:chemotaxis protein CheA [Andreesenia angusta]|uniref:Chemotaxis protein CheA n=1 Tax=Andreesenia angusta TaxID=39480 RepID=A0A1S1VAJ2_9FIRM|nr:chemotaxis protein CheA [Andreesenia angusta]OHW62779.1 chemotaxis protein CheA [Andreesenia angusta]
MDMNQYLDIFIEESKEHLQHMNDKLLELENNYDEIGLLNEIFRVAHTLKGMSGTMGFTKIASLTHTMENMLDAMRNSEIKTTPEIIDILFRCFDSLDEYINNIVETGVEGELDSTELVNEIDKTLKGDAEPEVKASESSGLQQGAEIDEYVKHAMQESKEKGMNPYRITVEVSEDCMLKAARAFIVFTTIEEHGEILQSDPSAEDIEDEKFDNKFSVLVVSEKSGEELQKEIANISDLKSVAVESIDLSGTDSSQETVEELKEEKAEELAVEAEQAAFAEQTDMAASPKKEVEKPEKKAVAKNNNAKIGKTVRVDIDRLDNLMNLVSELIIIKTRLEDTGSADKGNMTEAVEYLERITTSLHDAVMKVRMVPIERVFNRFPRMVRDLTKDLGKNIDLRMSGEETEVDRTIIDEIGDPLIHLIRNSIDHGIEKPEERRAAGKPEKGIVDLKAYPDGNSVVIELDDDGAGLNLPKIKAKAVERGVITQEEANTLPKEDAIDLLFRPGFSTADVISDVSGRGVGLDVVKTKIESISGNIEVKTEEGQGSKFIIRLPLTLAIIQALLIKLSDEIYAIPLSSISEISTIKRESIRKVQEQEVILFRNKTLPIIDLSNVLGLSRELEAEDLTIVIVRKGEKEAGLIIDGLIGQQEIVIKSLGKFLLDTPYLAGATILGNGRISLILDVNSLF